MMTVTLDTEQQKRLRWQCRRGMLELDILLGRFLDEHYTSLPENEKQLFINLLSCNDQELFNWLVKHEPVVDQDLAFIINKIC